MSTLPPNLRYERKFVVPGRLLAEVIALVRRHPAVFRETYPSRAVNNIYLDSPHLRDYFEHVSGASERVKTRIRWYGSLFGPVEKPVLERKIKCGLVSGKATYVLPPFALNGSGLCPVVNALVGRAGLHQRLEWAVRPLEPSLVNRYRRHYFLSANRCIRLTVDSGLEFFGPRLLTGSTLLRSRQGAAVIVELKFDAAHADQAEPVASSLPFRLTRCSKYVLGIEHLAATGATV